MDHVDIFKEPGRYGGWPANYGMWCWGQEIVLCFIAGFMDPNGGFHARDKSRPWTTMQSRSVDGGMTWDVVKAPLKSPDDKALSADEHATANLEIVTFDAGSLPPPVEPVDFEHKDFAMMCARTGLHTGAVSWFYYSYDRCQTWLGPHGLPDFGAPGISARTDIIPQSSNEALFFLTAAKSDGNEGRVFCARTNDGGQSFEFVSWIGPEPPGYAIIPSTVQLDESSLLTAVRHRGGERCWINAYTSDDLGVTWSYLNTPADNTGAGGNPPALIHLRDGRLCLVYGYRDWPYGMRCRISEDGGKTWLDEKILRDDGGNHDVGYPRAIERSDGKVVSAYYHNDEPDTERYIAATIFDPDEL